MAQFNTGAKNPPWASQANQDQQLQSLLRAQQAAIGYQQGVGLGAGGERIATTAQQPQQSLLGAQPVYGQTLVGGVTLGTALGSTTVTQAAYNQLQAQPALLQQQQALQQLQPQTVQQQAVLQQPGLAIPTTLSAVQQPVPGGAPQMGQGSQLTVSYPTPRAAQQQQQQPKQRVFTGSVTKLHDNFGFVDEDVFFQLSVCKGKTPQVGDRVLVEATYNANMPFKWNATRIQVLPNQANDTLQDLQSLHKPGVLWGHVADRKMHDRHSKQPWRNATMETQPLLKNPPVSASHAPMVTPPAPQLYQAGGPGITPSSIPPLMSQHTQPPANHHHQKWSRGPQQGQDQKPGLLAPPARGPIAPARRPEPPPRISRRDDRDRRDRSRDRSRSRERSERRPRSRSPRKRSRSPRRRSPRRERRRIVPRYMVTFAKFSLDQKAASVAELRRRYANMYVPSDFFHTRFCWTGAFPLHRPFQLGNPSSFHIMHKEVEPLEKNDTVLEPPDADHLYSAKVMLMACPSAEELYHRSCALAEDASDVRETFQHPTRLIQFLVGMKGKNEAVAIGGPWSPSLDGPNPDTDPSVLIKTAIRTTKALTGIDLRNCTQWYRFAEVRYHRAAETYKGKTIPERVETTVLFLPDVWHCLPPRLDWAHVSAGYRAQLARKLAQEKAEEAGESQEEEEGGEEEAGKKAPTHHTELDPKTMKVNELRAELEARGLNSKGLKSQLIARLTKALKQEVEKEEEEKEAKDEAKEEEEEEKEEEVEEDKEKKEEEERKKQEEERERKTRERRYTLPDSPAIVVHPSPTAKGGKFDCAVMSLSVLLDYRVEDNKEHSFEVSLFAELLNEMLQRDFAFKIYRALMVAPEPKKEEKKDKKDKKDKDTKKEEKKDDKKKDEKEEKEEKKEDVEESEDPKPKRRKTDEEEKPDVKKDKEDEKKDGDEEEEEEEEEGDDSSEEEEEEEENKDGEEKDRGDKKDKDEKKGKEKKKSSREKDRHSRERQKEFTQDKDLLLAFVYFDQSHCGYLLDRDLEEIMHTIGLQLSRAQIRKLVQKVVTRDSLSYRKLTDRPAADKDKPADSLPSMPEDQELAIGNNSYLEVQVKTEADVPAREGGQTSQGMVLYKGATIDIANLLSRLERSERDRVAVEEKVADQQADLDVLRAMTSSSEETTKTLASELKEVKKKLSDTSKTLQDVEKTCGSYRECLDKTRAHLEETVGAIKVTLPKPTPLEVKEEEMETTPAENGQKD
ncbi:cell division cycle and apoptosis regulator protein 1-like isoform X2 [Branchiostoma lanceolatum]|uniref:cell division cycle and apoptosis regulator protein 1-like isoform X2 n=1 Tax=Branchiostoma lanceolatum TaxID=7740 RepID=UPI003454E87B